MRSPTSSNASEPSGHSDRSHSIFSPAFSSPRRTGTISSAVFNLTTTMVGGGVLSLPYAFSKSGVITGFLLLLLFGIVADFTVYSLVSCSRRSGQPAFEGVAKAALGQSGYTTTLVCVILTTFLAVVGYAVLLRDLLIPLTTHFIDPSVTKDHYGNLIMLCVASLVTPLMFLDSLTSLKPMGVVGCTTIGCLALCIAYRTMTCGGDPKFLDEDDVPVDPPDTESLSDYIKLFGSLPDVLDSIPIFICTYVCHFNVLPVHHELQTPTRHRLRRLIHTTFMVTGCFYAFVGTMGMLVGNCPYFSTGDPTWQRLAVQGNVLKNFSDDDAIMNAGRACLSCTITLAFPLLVVPCRDMIVRLGLKWSEEQSRSDLSVDSMTAPLLPAASEPPSVISGGLPPSISRASSLDTSTHSGKSSGPRASKVLVVTATLAVFWGGLAIACMVDDIEVVWDVLGSTISILIAFLLPSASYLVLAKHKSKRQKGSSMGGMLDKAGTADQGSDSSPDSVAFGGPPPPSPALSIRSTWSGGGLLDGAQTNSRRVFAYFILATFTPMMFVCTWNAIHNLVANNS